MARSHIKQDVPHFFSPAEHWRLLEASGSLMLAQPATRGSCGCVCEGPHVKNTNRFVKQILWPFKLAHCVHVITRKDVLLRGSKSFAPFVWCNWGEKVRTEREREVLNEALLDHQGHVISLSGKLHFNMNLVRWTTTPDKKVRHWGSGQLEVAVN